MLFFAIIAVVVSKLVSMAYYGEQNCGGKPMKYQFIPPDECLKNTAGGSFKLEIEDKDVKFGIYNAPDTTCSTTPTYDVFKFGCNPQQNMGITVNDTINFPDKGWMLEAIYNNANCDESSIYAGIAQKDEKCNPGSCTKVTDKESYQILCSPFTWPKAPVRRSYRTAKVDEISILRK